MERAATVDVSSHYWRTSERAMASLDSSQPTREREDHTPLTLERAEGIEVGGLARARPLAPPEDERPSRRFYLADGVLICCHRQARARLGPLFGGHPDWHWDNSNSVHRHHKKGARQCRKTASALVRTPYHYTATNE